MRVRGQGHGALHDFTGSTIPFADSPEERRITRDPRPSIAERYGDAATYRRLIGEAAQRLVAERLMLEEDVDRCIAAAASWHAPRHEVGLS